jgi:Protein of unknown function (DUF3105)
VRRLLAGLLVLVLAAAAVAAGLLALQSRDDAGVSDGPAGPGEHVADRCPAHAAPVTQDARRLSPAQVLTALSQGNVVLTYTGAAPPAPLRRLQRDLTGPFDAEIAAAGQAVILARGPASQARAWGRRLVAAPSQQGALREFAEAWLGKGAPEPCDA